ncbi:MAG: DUF4363 family protein [Peptococcaceae bacterium]|jgi:hypothetical protein|nr:DUF4363 family protein [Peptococcaceae bacterium]MDH7524656.1 DUF4363 family protein [Peptococcaceae bacterium]
MKRDHLVPLALFFLALSIILLGWGNYLLLDRDSRDLLESVGKMRQAVENGGWDDAQKTLDEARQKWQKINRYWPMLVHHEEIDRIEESINKLKSYLAHEDKTESMAELYSLGYFLKHIPQKEAFTLRNIL